jgi:hypothetical protein
VINVSTTDLTNQYWSNGKPTRYKIFW